jgi:hypothetical protein
MWTLGLTAVVAFGLGTQAMADGTVPEEYQGVWAAARDCTASFQNILSDTVNRQFAACRVMQVQNFAHQGAHTSAISLSCGNSHSREIWHSESIDGTDYLVIIRFDQVGEAGPPWIDMYKRCPGIPISEIALSEIPGNPVAETASEKEIAPPSRVVRVVRQRPYPHSRTARLRKHSSQQK